MNEKSNETDNVSEKVALAQILNELRIANTYLELISRPELRYTQEALKIEANMQERAKRRSAANSGV